MQPTLTVFTPTYNRALTLPRVFESLRRQTCRDFVWLIVDDGSTDGTRELVAGWRDIADFPVVYLYQANSGKHNAHNAAVAQASTELFSIVDSDDELLPHAVETLTAEWKRMGPAERAGIAGIWTLCKDGEGRIVGGEFPQARMDATLQELRYKLHMNQEMLPTFVTAVLRRHPFPATPPGACPWVPEAYIWMRITRTHRLRFMNVPCRVYHQGDGLSVLGRQEYRLARCIVFGYLGPVTNDLDYFWNAPALFLMSAVQAARYAIFSRQWSALLRPLTLKARLLMWIAAPLALLLIARDRLSGRIARQLAAGAPPGGASSELR